MGYLYGFCSIEESEQSHWCKSNGIYGDCVSRLYLWPHDCALVYHWLVRYSLDWGSCVRLTVHWSSCSCLHRKPKVNAGWAACLLSCTNERRSCISSGGAPTPLTHQCSWWNFTQIKVLRWDTGMEHLWLKWVEHLWLKWVGHLWLKWVGHLWLKWVGHLRQMGEAFTA